MRLSGNQLTGSIPSELGNLTSLTELWLGSNRLTGAIPTELSKPCQPRGAVSFLEQAMGPETSSYEGGMTGPIPSELSNLANLTRLYLSGNQLTGAIPTELGNLSSLTNLSLGTNQLTGAIPTELGNLSSLTNLSLAPTN